MGQFLGKFRGIVIDVKDPESRGRIRVKCPTVYGESSVSPWALPCLPPNILVLPKKDDLVWMEFEEGDRDFPVWIGLFYTKVQFKKKFGNVYDPEASKVLSKGKVLVKSEEDSVEIEADGDFKTTTGGINDLN